MEHNRNTSEMTQKKLMLVQAIRQENECNQYRMKQRRELLYGEDKGSFEAVQEEMSIPGRMSGSFLFRTVIAVFVFVLFLFCDINKIQFYGIKTENILNCMNEDTFHLNEDNAMKEQLLSLLDFVH